MDVVKIRYHVDRETGEPHIYNHGVSEDEVEDVLDLPGEDLPARNQSRSIIGQTAGGRYLRVIAVHDPDEDSILVVTAYDLSPRQLAAYKRRRRKRT
jgi:hypothetical protein